MAKRSCRWSCCDRHFDFRSRPLLMGILNITPDSFSDGGRWYDIPHAIEKAYRLYEEGADLIDIGGESSRPGASPVPWEEERRRVIPVIEEIAGKAGIPVSIDTIKYEIAQEALESGAVIINDISGLQADPRLADLAASAGCGLVIMHMRGTPQTMQSLTEYGSVIEEIRSFFTRQVGMAKGAGVREAQMVLDPGIGFGKTADQNLRILNRLDELRLSSYPLLLGISRKSVLGKVTGKDVQDRLYATAAAVAAGILRGANILRVHDVREMKDVILTAEAIRREAVSWEE